MPGKFQVVKPRETKHGWIKDQTKVVLARSEVQNRPGSMFPAWGRVLGGRGECEGKTCFIDLSFSCLMRQQSWSKPFQNADGDETTWKQYYCW